MKAIIIHGGAGGIPTGERKDTVREGIMASVLEGVRALEAGSSAIDAVLASVMHMEDSGVFNAGRGSYPSMSGEVEMDAAIAISDGRFGAVASIPNIRNPIKVAYEVMKRTRHVLLAGSQAKRIAVKLGFEEYPKDMLTKLHLLEEAERRLSSRSSLLAEMYRVNRALWNVTVGAIAIDDDGIIVSGVSTGGLWMKLPGRVGDSPIHGAGLIASPLCGVVATGYGEVIIKSLLSVRVLDYVRQGLGLKLASKRVMNYINRKFGEDNTGFIALGRYGEAYRIHNTAAMSTAVWWEGLDEPIFSLTGEDHYIFKL
jgi:beta-aspartyl-peptidase (threonine type)